jgi:RNA polymerase-binding protein DksA
MAESKSPPGRVRRALGGVVKAVQSPSKKAAQKQAAAAKQSQPVKVAAAKHAEPAKAAAAKQAAPGKVASKVPAVKQAAPAKVAVKAPAKQAAPAKTPAKAPAKTPAKTPAKAPAKAAPVKGAAAKKSAPVKAPAAKQAAPAKAPAAKQAAPVKVAAAKQAAPVKAPAPAPKPKKLVVRGDESPWTAKELSAVRTELESEVERLRHDIAIAEGDLADLLRDSGDGAGDDQADAGTKTFEREHEMSLAANSRDMLEQTERALHRIDDGTYGVCEICGNPIGKRRLQAFPRATLCMEDKQREERR